MELTPLAQKYEDSLRTFSFVSAASHDLERGYMGFMGDCRKPDMKCNGRNKCNRCQSQMDRLERQARDGDVPVRRRKTGSTMYGRRHGSSQEPRGGQGEFNPRTGEGHGTQYYDDNTRLSWDTDGSGESGHHWTDQNKGKRHPDRQLPTS